MKTVCKSSRLYSFELDRIVTPVELLRVHGWDLDGLGGVPPVTLTGIPRSKAYDLIGECMAMQSVAVAIWSLVCATGTATKGVWPVAAP